MVGALDSDISGSSYADPELAALFSDEAQLSAWLQVETTLAQVQEALGIIPAGSGALIAQQLQDAPPELANLRRGYEQDGIAIPALTQSLRQRLPATAGNYLHYGATSQDIVDTALMLRLKRATGLLDARLSRLMAQLGDLAQDHRHSVMIARTRKRSAAPTVFGLQVVDWLAPLKRQRTRLEQLLPRLLLVQLGGAVGTQAALQPDGPAVNAALAKALGLAAAEPWHVQRDGLVEFGNWLAMTAGLLGKMGQDLLLLAQSGIEEVAFAAAGKSSTLPNKSNPVLAENLVAQASYCCSHGASLQQSLLASQARDGVCLALEQLTLGPLVCGCAASLSTASTAIERLAVNPQVMLDNIARDRGNMLAEAAVYALSRVLDRQQATKLVSAACAKSAAEGVHMIDALRAATTAAVDWDALRQPENYLGSAQQTIDRVLARGDE